MKHWFATLLGAYCSLNVIVIATTTRQETTTPARAKVVSSQEPESLKVAAADKRTDDPDQILFDAWEKPDFALLISGRLDGYIEPCGCTGLENQKGGLLRRHTFLKQLLNDRGWNVAAIDTGNQINRTGEQSLIKLKTTWRGLFETMQYQAASIGVDDLKAPSIELISAIENLNLGDDSPFVCANAILFSDRYTKPIKIFNVGGRKIGLTAVLGDDELKVLAGVIDTDVKLIPVNKALPNAIAMLQQEKCDLYVLIANTSLEEGRKLAAQYPAFDLVISANGVGEPTIAPERIENKDRVTSLIQVGSKGMHVGVLGFYDDNGRLSSRYQRVPLDSRFGDSDEMKVVFKEYQNELGRKSFEELRIAPKKHPEDRENGRQFVGSSSCEDCHEYAYKVWEEGHERPDNPKHVGPHSRATLDLTEPGERTWVTREKDPECLSCHVTGWNPQGFFPYETGYTNIKDVDLHGNGCENCHGPGSKHVEAEEAKPKPPAAVLDKRRQEMVVTLEKARNELCMNCHDLDNSPDFHQPGAFEKYWAKIDHTKPKDAKPDAKADGEK